MADAPFPPCRSCSEPALSFSDSCWGHVDHRTYPSQLAEGLEASRSDVPLRLNLRKARLTGIDLSGRRLAGSSFSQALLTGVNLVGSDASESDFIGSRLHECDFVGA